MNWKQADLKKRVELKRDVNVIRNNYTGNKSASKKRKPSFYPEDLYSCGCTLAFVLFNLLVGGWSVNFLLAVLGISIPFVGDMIIGMFIAQISVPVALVILILRAFGVAI